ncbi:hypothetical protein EJ04DRAFT_150610 [Polyplosphaeria fusca]|uniref:Uncharacterized protein n=1 Tax=Polyplosphaeria fusca TaxID=682080 RepID=A0A9P4QZK3_9PLEO|nr:hypothetical protein EJ04DRAFT_150610 [Polyplosphaeria fusca]
MRPLDELGQTVEKWWDTINLRDQFELLFRSALEEQTKPDRGRAALIDYSEGGEGSPKIFTSHLDLKNQLNGIQDILFGHAKGRYLIILEDLSRNWVELLGPALRIPISVFALHMASPEDHILGRARVPLGESPGRHFVLSYQQPTKLEIAPKSKDKVYRIDCAANRLINTKIKVDRMTGPETAEQLVSYWGRQSLASDANTVGSSYESWIAIMLVDPCPTRDLGLKKSAPSPVPQKDEEDEDDDEDNDVNGPTLITRRYQHPPRLSRLNKAPNVGKVS